MWVRHSETRTEPLPIPSRIASNEEFIPPPQTPEQKRYEARLKEISEDGAKAQGLDRQRHGGGTARSQ
jgi:hypothetical protein